MNIEQQWQAAKEEFGKDAFKRARIKTVINTFLFPKSNAATESAINHAEIEGDEIEFIPLPYLFSHDVEVYGDNAYLMWEIKYSKIPIPSNDEIINALSAIGINKLLQRKKSAALPFDLERAKAGKAGDVVESLWTDGEWAVYPTIIKENCFIEKDKLIHPDYGWIFVHDLRMKYPPRLKK